MLGVNSEQKESMQHYISDSIYGLTLAWITSENSTKQLECRHLDSVFFAGPYLMLARLSAHLSGIDCPCLWFHANSSSSFLQATLFSCPVTSSGHAEISSPKNPLSGFAPKQTKESSAWRATYIVLHLYCRHYYCVVMIMYLYSWSWACNKNALHLAIAKMR